MAHQAGKCDGVGLPDYSSCPRCGGIPCPVCVQGIDVDACLQGACNGCSGEQCGYCFDEARRGCCLGKWMAPYTGNCDGVDLPDYSSCPKCGDIPCPVCVQGLDVDACLQEECSGCSGEQCGHCRDQARRGCCLGKWMAQYTGNCDGVDLPDYSSCPKGGDIPCPVCAQGLDAADACLQEKCRGCSGEQCEYCHEECKWGAIPTQAPTLAPTPAPTAAPTRVPTPAPTMAPTAPATVSCGSHSAASCAECPQGNGESWCNGDCSWRDGSCQVPQNSATCTSLSQTVPAPCPAVTGGSGAPINIALTCVYNPSCTSAAPPVGCFEATGCQYHGHS